ncbi:TIGR03885 family FMN-dependent LLM class oxidoreductase [Oerskovia flava]|uniref:TIGR03885 family FMN-dependent LLM class oxidoreductase n=1 Tax=Oerskovia flava TaxID=2986422 RepID=UPI00223FB2EA|nr:TIGR03885 family FMN-dependent LLM class oxidoreductase [Oerskovia sp. JB1-3-2]
MVTIGFHHSHEQVHPTALLQAARTAQDVGFRAGMCSDHFAPWSLRQGHSAFSWAWLGAALATTDLPFGVVAAPGQRYHPAVYAQAVATLAAMFPGRFWVAMGSGENLNEHITGDGWPSKPDRDTRLRECVEIVRALLDGEEVTHDGSVTVDHARLWTLPDVPPRLVLPAVTAATAARHADWADGLVTVNQPVETLRDVVGSYRAAGGRGATALQVHVSWGRSDEVALRTAQDQWGANLLPPPVSWDLDEPESFDAARGVVSEEALRRTVLVEHDAERLADCIAELVEVGFDEVYLHHVGQEFDEFFDVAGAELLPRLSAAFGTDETAGESS